MEELLSLKWNNHKNCFIQLLSVLRKKSTYTDVTLACDGQFYNAHKVVLSACSDYFSNIFEYIKCSEPVIILKDLSATNLESLLDYMYIGEVNVRQTDLTSLLQAAECLKLKGLAVPEAGIDVKSDNRKRPASPSPSKGKKSRKTDKNEASPNHCETPVEEDLFDKPDVQPSDNIPSALKSEDCSEEVYPIKQELDASAEEFTDAWNFNPSPGKFEGNTDTFGDVSKHSIFSSTMSMDPLNETESSCNESDFGSQLLPASSSQYTDIQEENFQADSDFALQSSSDYLPQAGIIHKREEAKLKRQSGKAYTNRKGQIIEEKKMKFVKCSCRYNCEEVFPEEERRKIHSAFWGFSNWQAQSNFILSSVKVYNPKRRTVPHSRRNYTRKYLMCGKPVCQKVYLGTLAINHMRVEYCLNKKKSDTGTCSPDRRGKASQSKTPISLEEFNFANND